MIYFHYELFWHPLIKKTRDGKELEVAELIFVGSDPESQD